MSIMSVADALLVALGVVFLFVVLALAGWIERRHRVSR